MKIKENRKKLNMTQSELAQELNIAKSTISKWENGTMEPSIGDVSKMATLFNISIDSLIGGQVVQEKQKAKNNEEPIMVEYMYGDDYGVWEETTRKIKKPFMLVKMFGKNIHLALLYWITVFMAPWIIVLLGTVGLPNGYVFPPFLFVVAMIIIVFAIYHDANRIYRYGWIKQGRNFSDFQKVFIPWFMPLILMYRMFKVDWEPDMEVPESIWHQDMFGAFKNHFEISSFDPNDDKFVPWKNVVDIHLPILNKTRTIKVPHETVSKIKSDQLFGETYTQTNKTMVSHTEHYQEFGVIEIAMDNGSRIGIDSNSESDYSLLVSIWKG